MKNQQKDVSYQNERAVIQERVVEKIIEVVVDKPVPVYKEV